MIWGKRCACALGATRKMQLSTFFLQAPCCLDTPLSPLSHKAAATHKHHVAILVFAQGKPDGHPVDVAQSDRHDPAVNNDYA